MNVNLGIGTTSPDGKLDVNGTIYQRGKVLHADYVFEPTYKLGSMEERAAYMWQNKDLKAVPKAKRDECVDCQQFCPPGLPNCATTKEEAKEWWGDLVGKVARVNYIRGCCGNKEYIRPTIAFLMNDPDKAEDFGPVNERYLRQALEGLWEK